MQNLYTILEKTSSRIGFAILLSLQMLVGWRISANMENLAAVSGGNGILDFEIGYNPAKVMEVLGSYGPEGMEIYGNIQALDLINPLLYSILWASVIYLLLRESRFVWMSALPLLGGLLDYIENGFLFVMARTYPDIAEWVIDISSLMSLVKRGAMIAAIAALLFAIVHRLMRWRNG